MSYKFTWIYADARKKRIEAVVRGMYPGEWKAPYIEAAPFQSIKYMTKRDVKKLLANFDCGRYQILDRNAEFDHPFIDISQAPSEVLKSLKSFLENF